MSHFNALVIGPTSVDEVDAAVEPFEWRRFDWYDIGGRFTGRLPLSWGDHGLVSDLDPDHLTFAVIADGQWHQRGQMRFFAVVDDEKDVATWRDEAQELLKAAGPDAHVWLVDFHAYGSG